MLAIYDLHRIDALNELFTLAYEPSAARYAAVQQTIGEPDFTQLVLDELISINDGKFARYRVGP